jgi:hypothetical protein
MTRNYFHDDEQVRQCVRQGLIRGVKVPWPWGNRDAEMEFWQVALTLDDGKFLDQFGLTDYANRFIAYWTAYQRTGGSVGGGAGLGDPPLLHG